MMIDKIRIGVLMGGPSSEREVSLKSGKAVFSALKSLGLEAVAIDVQREDRKYVKDLLLSYDIGLAFWPCTALLARMVRFRPSWKKWGCLYRIRPAFQLPGNG